MTFLGVGSAFAKRNFQSNVLVEVWRTGPEYQSEPDDTLMIDFGTTGPLALWHLGAVPGFEYLRDGNRVNFPAIHRVFITHQHADHIGGLEEMGMTNFYCFRTTTGKPFKPQIISSPSILMNLWDSSLKGGMSAMAGRYALLQDYFFILAIKPGDGEAGKDGFTLMKRYQCCPFVTDHIQIERNFDWPSYGLRIVDNQSSESVFFSGDTRFDYPAYAPMLEAARCIFHEVQLTDVANPVHALLSQLKTMPESIRRKCHLYHFEDSYDTGPYAEVATEFAGFAQPQKRYVVLD